MPRRRAAAQGRGVTEVCRAAFGMEGGRRASYCEDLSVSRFPTSAGLRESGGNGGGGAGSSSGSAADVGKSRSEDVYAQDRWIDGERFHSGGEDRSGGGWE